MIPPSLYLLGDLGDNDDVGSVNIAFKVTELLSTIISTSPLISLFFHTDNESINNLYSVYWKESPKWRFKSFTVCVTIKQISGRVEYSNHM